MTTAGIIGAGRIGRVHAENMSKMRNVRLKSISDLCIDPLKSWAEDLGIEKSLSDSMEILRDEEIDAVFICSPTSTHVSIIQEAAKRGKHIFCEKPISLNMEESNEAVRVAKECGVKLQIGFNRRFDPNFQRVHNVVKSGKIGDVQIVKITSRDPLPPSEQYLKTSGGLFIDMAIHDYDMARFIIGSEVEEVYAQGGVLINPICDEIGDVDTAVTLLKFRNGAMAVIDNSRKAVYGYDQRLEAFGSKGCVAVENDRPTTATISSEEGVIIDNPKYFFLERYKEAYVNEVQEFFRAIELNEAPRVTGEDAYQAETIAYAAKVSWHEQRAVKISAVNLLHTTSLS